MKQPNWLSILVLTVIGVFALFYFVDTAMFANYGSIRPVKDASKVFKNIDELAVSCKASNQSNVLIIHTLNSGMVQARCDGDFFPQTWDVSKLIP